MQLYKHFGHLVDRFCFVSLRLEFFPAFFFAENSFGAVHKLCRFSRGGEVKNCRFYTVKRRLREGGQKSPILRRHSLWTTPQWGGRAAKSKETKRISSHLRPCFSCFSTPKHPLTHVLINNSSRRALLDAMARWWFYRILALIQSMYIHFKLM